ncbi:hypothetical protein NGM37_52100, partial [Streptomyces sp. TRM76130]|nr:hypothetical protein [Streptomyces sp. TRM76130]
ETETRTGTPEPVSTAAAGAATGTGAETGAETRAETGAAAIGTPAFTRAVHRAVAAWAADADGSEPSASAARPLVIVDQFEETFALCPDEAERRAFIQTLHAMCSPADSGEPPPAHVLVGVRADFYEQCLG